MTSIKNGTALLLFLPGRAEKTISGLAHYQTKPRRIRSAAGAASELHQNPRIDLSPLISFIYLVLCPCSLADPMASLTGNDVIVASTRTYHSRGTLYTEEQIQLHRLTSAKILSAASIHILKAKLHEYGLGIREG